jgi:SAM-dependent methyltransferase
MLERARVKAPTAMLVRGSAGALPWADGSIDRILCVNALHHFPDRRATLAECRRVLRSGGGVLTAGLDPHTGADEWWVYDYFPAARHADRLRYASTATIRAELVDAGFRRASTEVAQHLPVALPFDAAWEQGLVHRQSTSQLMVISDAEYGAGVDRLRAERPVLRADLRIYATTAWV